MIKLAKTLFGPLIALIFLGSGLSHAEVVSVRVGYSSAAEEPLWVMKASPQATPNQGRKYALNYTSFRGSDKVFQALEAGELDIAPGSARAVMMAASQGLRFKVVASLSREGGGGFATQYMVRDDSPIKTIADLKGKTLGINGVRSSSEIWARLVLRKHSLDPQRDVKWVAIPFPSQGEAVRAGKLDIGAFPQPFAAFEEERGGMRTVFTSLDGIGGQQEDLMLLLATEKFAAEHPDVLRAFLSDLVKANHFLSDNPKESVQQLIDARFVNIPLETYLSMRGYEHPRDAKVDMPAIHRMVSELTEFGYAKGGLDPASIVDMGFLPE